MLSYVKLCCGHNPIVSGALLNRTKFIVVWAIALHEVTQ